MQLTAEEQTWLAGDGGPALRRAMEIVVALGSIYGAERLIPIKSVQISGVSYRNIGVAGLEFLSQWAEEGARVRVPTMLNPAAMDLNCWQEQGFDPDFATEQHKVIQAFARMGVGQGTPVPTCTPYLIGAEPAVGDHIAWAESSAVSYANSVLGAYTNREGGPGAIAAALAGRTGAYGLHLPENRIATHKVTVTAPLREISDYSALGALVGKQVQKAIPYFANLLLDKSDPLWQEKLKALGAAMAATGAVAVYHAAGLTPEALAGDMLAADHTEVTVDVLAPGYAMLSDPGNVVDLVWIGCPHASLKELKLVSELVTGKTLAIPLWITCARPVLELAQAHGFLDVLHAAGAHIYADACMAIAPVKALGFGAVATPSAKGAYYLRNLAGVNAHFGTLEQCVESSLNGTWCGYGG